MNEPLQISDAAADLGISAPTLRRWITAGAPVARRGGRGRGNRTLICPAAVRRWKDSDKADAALLSVIGDIPELLAHNAMEAFKLAPDKRGAAWALCAGWQLGVGAIHDRLTDAGIDMPEPVRPAEIERLLKLIDR